MGSVIQCPEKPTDFNSERMSARGKSESVGPLPVMLLSGVLQGDSNALTEEAPWHLWPKRKESLR